MTRSIVQKLGSSEISTALKLADNHGAMVATDHRLAAICKVPNPTGTML
jgi:hypothetical protein